MSISRKNWSALSNLALRWTMEDEEEVERERRRKVRGSSSSADPDNVFSPGLEDTGDSHGTFTTSDTNQALSSAEQLQLDFVEMLRVRDEKRRMRHVETLRRQKQEEEEEDEEPRVELLGDLDGEEDSEPVSRSAINLSKPQQTTTRVTCSHRSSISSDTSSSTTDTQYENGESSTKDLDPKPSSNPTRKFVSSVSISLDKSPSTSGRTTPMSPCSPAPPLSPRENCSSSRPTPSPVQNGHKHETTVNGSSNFEPTSKPAFVRQSSRTISFRMMRKKEEETSPLQRSASVRAASKKFEWNPEQNQDEDSATSSFQRNSRQRISSRSIQEKMERLAQAAQKSEMVRSPDVAQKTLSLMEEVSRKRGIFEKDQLQSPTSSGISKQEFRNIRTGMSERINKWINKTSQTGSSHSPLDLMHVDITSMKTLFEKRADDVPSKSSSGKK